MKKVLFVVLMVSLVIGGYLTFTTFDSESPVATAAKKTYSGKMYIAGMGGHFGVADVTIDPNDAEKPIKLNAPLGMLNIGGITHPTHDARIDVNDRSKMYWSTYKFDNWKDDSKKEGFLHVGLSDLKTGAVIKDTKIAKTDREVDVPANYCGSGQNEKYFLPVSMANEGYIDVIDKGTVEQKCRVWLSDLGIKPGETTFAHGINYPDMKHFLLSVNITPQGFTKWTGETQLIKLDMASLVNDCKAKKVAEATIKGGTPGKTITFRQYFSDDGKYFFQSGADRGYLIDGASLKVLDEITPLPGENHDIIPTPDAKYAVMTLREKIKDASGNEIVDGTLLLYDVEAKKTVGQTVSVCYDCHKNVGKAGGVLCGLDVNWK